MVGGTSRDCWIFTMMEVPHLGCEKFEGALGVYKETCYCDTDLCNGVEPVITSSCGHVIIMIALLISVLLRRVQ